MSCNPAFSFPLLMFLSGVLILDEYSVKDRRGGGVVYGFYTEFATDTVYGWSKLIFHNCSHLTDQFVASGNVNVLDKVTLYKERKC